MDLTHWDIVEIDFTFEQVASLACDWDPYRDQFERPPPAIAAKRAFLLDKMREGYTDTVRWCIATFERSRNGNKLDEDGFLLLPALPLRNRWPYDIFPLITPDVEGLWADVASNKDFDLPAYLKRLPPPEQQSVDRLPVCAFLASIGWKSGYDFTYGMGAVATRSLDQTYIYKSPEEVADALSNADERGTLRTPAEATNGNHPTVLYSVEPPLHPRTQQHYLKVIAGLLTAHGFDRNTNAMEVLRMLELDGKQPAIDHRTLVQTLRKVNSLR